MSITRSSAIVALVLALSLVSSLRASAQDSGEDPFAPGAFDSGSAAGATTQGGGGQSASVARTEYLVGGTALVTASASLPPGMDGYAASSYLVGQAFAKVSIPDYGSLYISYNLALALFQARGGEGKLGLVTPLELGSPSWSVSEAHYSFDIAKSLFARVGRQLISWGPALIWNPVDFINPQKADSFSSVDLRTGRDGLRIHLPLGSSNLFAFLDFSGLVSGSVVNDVQDALIYAGRFDTTLGGFELGFTAYGGPGTQAKLGFDFSGAVLGFTAYGDLAWALGYDSYSESLKAGLGLSRTLGDLKNWTLAAEGYWQSDGKDLTGDLPGMAASSSLYMGGYYAYVTLEAKKLFSPSLTTKLSALANLSDGSWRLKLEEGLAFPRFLPLSVSLTYAGGGADKEFTYLYGDGGLTLGVRTVMAF